MRGIPVVKGRQPQGCAGVELTWRYLQRVLNNRYPFIRFSKLVCKEKVKESEDEI